MTPHNSIARCLGRLWVCATAAFLFVGCSSESNKPDAEVTKTASTAKKRFHDGESRKSAGDTRRSLADLLKETSDAATVEPLVLEEEDVFFGPPPEERRREERRRFLRSIGIRRLPGKYITLYTDLDSTPEVDALPDVFDLAVPKWCEYFDVKLADLGEWRMHGYLIKDRAKFERVGLLPQGLPPFKNGYCVGREMWLYEQPTDYYRRHLLLHEGTHGFMFTQLGSCGPPWYMEAMAERLATHRLADGKLTLRHFPANREEVPQLGRIKLIQDAFAEGRAINFAGVMKIDNRAHLENESYAWSWAAAALLDGHPRYRERFGKLYRHVNQYDFNQRMLDLFRDDWADLVEDWQLLAGTIEHAYDFDRNVVDYRPGSPLAEGNKSVAVAADRGWQNTGIELVEGKTYRLKAAGRYIVAREPKDWECEPDGVTVRYYKGKPLGVLLGAIHPDGDRRAAVSPLLAPMQLGSEIVLHPRATGTLYLKINDSPGELADNSGELSVEIAAE